MRIPISITSWKSRAMAAENECDSLRRELAAADQVEETLRARLDEALERINDYHRRAVIATAQVDLLRDESVRSIAELQGQLDRVKQWIATPSSVDRLATRRHLAEFLGWPVPTETVRDRNRQIRALAHENGEDPAA